MYQDPASNLRRTPAVICLAVITVMAAVACKEQPTALVTAPKTLPAFLPDFVQWSTSSRARGKAADGVAALQANDYQRARGLLTEAVSLDPSWIAARLGLARLYLKTGHNDIVIRLLEPLADGGDTCGGCIDAFAQIARDPAFKEFSASAKGKAVLARAPRKPLQWRRWADELSRALTDLQPAVIANYVHAQEHFELVRSCPECSNPKRRKPEVRRLQGASVAVKLATRFDTSRPRLDTVALRLRGQPTCAARCCTWQAPKSMTVGEAMLSRLCFRPVSANKAALTRIEIIYGQSINDRQQMQAAEKRRQEIEGIPLPQHPPTATSTPKP